MEDRNEIKTYFDTPDRSPDSEITQLHSHLKQQETINAILDGMPDLALILNMNRQIVAYNKKAYDTFTLLHETEILGKRPGEAIRCIHRDDMPAGCGTSEFCQECGAGNALKKTKETNTPAIEECRIISELEGKEIAFDFNVHVKQLRIGDEDFLFFAIEDISNQKRREALERIFFHDVLNTSGAVHGLASILYHSEKAGKQEEIIENLLSSADQLVREIQAQRQLRYAEDGKLDPDFRSVSVNSILKKVRDIYKNHRHAEGKRLEVNYPDNDIYVETDISIITRCIGNLTKNALEASDAGDKVTICVSLDSRDIQFHVKNDLVIPEHIQRQIFQRSFSTKGDKGRGIGTYSVKLLVEQYLKGKVSFISNENERTVFSITLFDVVSEKEDEAGKKYALGNFGKLSKDNDTASDMKDETLDVSQLPPKKVIDEIIELAKMGDIRELMKRCTSFRELYPEAEKFFNVLKPHIENYEVSKIEEQIIRMRGTG